MVSRTTTSSGKCAFYRLYITYGYVSSVLPSGLQKDIASQDTSTYSYLVKGGGGEAEGGGGEGGGGEGGGGEGGGGEGPWRRMDGVPLVNLLEPVHVHTWLRRKTVMIAPERRLSGGALAPLHALLHAHRCCPKARA